MRVKLARLHTAFFLAIVFCGAAVGDRRVTAGELGLSYSLSAYLLSVQHPATGLLESFAQSADPALADVAFTYDVAVSALVLAHAGQLEAADRALSLYRHLSPPQESFAGFNTAYDTQRSRPTLERVCHGGPVFWTAISFIRFGERARNARAVEQGIALLEWVVKTFPHYNGGVAMGPQEPWDGLMSVENNWVLYAALRVALPHVEAGPRREALLREKIALYRWLERHWRNRGDGDSVKALDVYTHALLVGPQAHLEDSPMDARELEAWARDWIGELEQLFRIPGTTRYDYTDALEARQVGRPRVSWLEGTEQVAVAYRTWAVFFEAQGDSAYADWLRRTASDAHREVMGFAIAEAGHAAIPNTDSPAPFQTFMDGWLARPVNEPALNGTNWAYFSEVGYNPFTSRLEDVR